MQLNDFQWVTLILGLLSGVGIIGYVIVLLAQHNTTATTALFEQVRANQPTMDFLETLGKELVPVGQVYLMAALSLPFIPATTDDEIKLRNVALDILKNLTDNKPWTAPMISTNTGPLPPFKTAEANPGEKQLSADKTQPEPAG